MTKAVCLGIQVVDVLGRPVSHIPEGQNVALIDEIRTTVSGAGAGTAIDLAKLGVEVCAMGAIGQDGLGDFLISTMQGYGIDTTFLKRKACVQTSSSILPIRPNGERPAWHVIGANGELTIDDIDFDVIAAADFLHVGGTCLLPKLDGEPTRKVMEYAKQKGVTTTLDPVAVKRPDLLDVVVICMPYVDYFMPGLEEAAMTCKLTDRKDVIRFFLERGAKHTVFKMGSDGSSIGFKDNGVIREKRIPAFRVPVVDSTGCGDAYCAGFIKGLSMDWDVDQAALLGTAAAGLVATGLGSDAGIVDLEQTLDFMNRAEHLPIRPETAECSDD